MSRQALKNSELFHLELETKDSMRFLNQITIKNSVLEYIANKLYKTLHKKAASGQSNNKLDSKTSPNTLSLAQGTIM